MRKESLFNYTHTIKMWGWVRRREHNRVRASELTPSAHIVSSAFAHSSDWFAIPRVSELIGRNRDNRGNGLEISRTIIFHLLPTSSASLSP